MSVVQMGSLNDFELLIRVFLVLRCRCESAGQSINKVYFKSDKEV